ncbi:MAG: hypothetical protein WEB09_05415 [Nitriliruptor sp.]
MTSVETSAPPSPPPPTRSQSIQLRWRAAKRSAAFPLTIVAVTALLLGVVAGRATAPAVDQDAVATIEQQVLPFAVDADGIWTAGTNGLPAVSTQLRTFRAEGDPTAVAPHVEGWLEAYDTVLRRIVGTEVPASVRPVQRQLVAAVTLSRDAVEVLAVSAEVADPATRRELTSEAVRLRIRAEQITQTAQAAITDLRGSVTTGVSVPPPVPSLAELR